MRRGRLARLDRVSRTKLRIEARSSRTSLEQLTFLDAKLGKDKGAARERCRLLRAISNDMNDKPRNKKLATTKTERRKEKAERYARRESSGN